MNLFSRPSRLLLLGAALLVTSFDAYSKKDEVVKYVKGGACTPGSGSQKHPYSSLAQAQADSSWDVLVVLSSTVTLDGGITLRDGQKIIGEENPTGITVSPTQPVITNTTTNNLQAGIVVTGNATIENLYIKDTESFGIEYSAAKNLAIKNVLITGASGTGIYADTETSGKTSLKHVIIRNLRPLEGGLAQRLSKGAERELVVCDSLFANLAGGIALLTIDPLTRSNAVIRDSHFRDYEKGLGVGASSATDSEQSVSITGSTFYNLNSVNLASIAGLSNSSSFKLNVDECLFEETEQRSSTRALFILSTDSVSQVSVKNSTVKNIEAAFFFPIQDEVKGSNQKIALNNNTVSALAFFATFLSANTPPISGQAVTEVVIKNNLFTGALGIFTASEVPWKRLSIFAEHNCFNAFSASDSTALFSNSGPANAGDATIRAHKNSFVGFASDIDDEGANIRYYLSKNYWGPAKGACANLNPPCPQYQTCKEGMCFGPQNVVVTGSASIDASNPLVTSIKCPHSCCTENPVPPTPPLRVASFTREETMKHFKTTVMDDIRIGLSNAFTFQK